MKCLAIDDEPLALAQLSDYISRVPFLSLVKPCQDAFEAMKVLSDEDVDLIFVDINMPDLNGLDFIRSLISRPMVGLTPAGDFHYRLFRICGGRLQVGCGGLSVETI